MAHTKLYTFQDAMEHLFLVMNPATKPPTGRELRAAKAAVIGAYRSLPSVHRWSYYKRRRLLLTEASYSTGTIDYDHTDGAAERLITLVGGTFPANAAYGFVKIGNVCYQVDTRESDTMVTLGENSNPGADVASGTSYEWFRSMYQLPTNFRKLNMIVRADSTGEELDYIAPDEYLVREKVYNDTSSEPDWYTIMNSNKAPESGYLHIAFCPPPNSAQTYELIYEVSPRELLTYLSNAGTVSVSAGGTTVTGSSTAFSANHVGCVMRVAASGSPAPTGVTGNSDGTTNVYLAQRVITKVSSTTSLTVDAAFSASALSTVGYTISDPLDVDPDAMLPYYLRQLEAEYARLNKREDADKLLGQAMFYLPFAIAADNKNARIMSGMLGYGTDGSSMVGDVDGVPV